MLTYTQALVLGLLQGVTELFPISSLGHMALLPALLHWQIDESAPYFLTFLIATHFATAIVLILYFWKDWWQMFIGFFRSIATRQVSTADTYARLPWLLIVATIPAGLLGLVFQDKIQGFFAEPRVVAIVLVLNGVLLYGIEMVKRSRIRYETMRGSGDAAIAKLGWFSAFGTGLMQVLALIPGFSRTGSSLAGGLLAGLDHESAVRFSFLLATPIILAAAVLKLPKLLHAPHGVLLPTLLGAVVAGIGAYFSVKFLTRYFKTNTLTPFAWYCIVAGLASYVLLYYV